MRLRLVADWLQRKSANVDVRLQSETDRLLCCLLMPSGNQPSQEMGRMRAAIAAELRAAAGRMNLNQGAVADRSGLHRVTVNRLFQGLRPVDSEQLAALAIALETTPGAILDAAFLKYRDELTGHAVESEGGGEH